MLSSIHRSVASSFPGDGAALGPDDVQIAHAGTNVADRYQEQGRYTEANPLNPRSVAIREGTLAPCHSYVTMSLNFALMCAATTSVEPLREASDDAVETMKASIVAELRARGTGFLVAPAGI